MARRFDRWTLGLWAAQIFLAAIYAFAGYTKLTATPADFAALGWGWAESIPLPAIRALGAAELAGALGVILPAATRILPWLTPLAAAGLTLVQLGAIPLHISRGEFSVLPFNLLLILLSIFVLWGRTRRWPVAPRAA